MRDDACVGFLQWALPQLRLRWPGFRKVRKQVRKRLVRRLTELGLADLDAYRVYLDDHADEWPMLDRACWITISRFYRDRGVFTHIAEKLLPDLAASLRDAGESTLRCWSAGCAAGEEPYSLRLIWTALPTTTTRRLELEITATDADSAQLERAAAAIYPLGNLKDLPADLRAAGFDPRGDAWQLRAELTAGVTFLRQDIRTAMPAGPFDLILCRNLVFTYFAADLQEQLGAELLTRLNPRGRLLLGKGETPPASLGLREVGPHLGIFAPPTAKS